MQALNEFYVAIYAFNYPEMQKNKKNALASALYSEPAEF